MFLARNMRPTLPQRWLASSSVAEKPRDSVASRSMFGTAPADRKSTRLNSSHLVISYAVFCLKKKNMTGNNLYHAIIGSALCYNIHPGDTATALMGLTCFVTLNEETGDTTVVIVYYLSGTHAD